MSQKGKTNERFSPKECAALGLAQSTSLLQCVVDLIGESLGRDSLPELASDAENASALAMALGNRTLAHLGSTIEQCFSFLYQGQIDPSSALPLLASGIETMIQAFSAQLETDAKDLTRVGSSPLGAAIYELHTLFPIHENKNSPPIARSKTGPDVFLSEVIRSNRPQRTSDV